jgi:hypothetical protein
MFLREQRHHSGEIVKLPPTNLGAERPAERVPFTTT